LRGLLTALVAVAGSPFSRQKVKLFIARMKADDLTALCELTKGAKIKPVIDRCYSLGAAAEAVAYVEGGHVRAKVIIGMG
jgi:NADPH:quinone reductase-like Zn-dependent oxidoreductase